MEKLLVFYLGWMARIVLKRHRPFIIGITGSIGKTSAREAIYSVLSLKNRVFRGRPEKNYNNEVGVPLVILGAEHHGRNIAGWISVFFLFVRRIISNSYPEILLLEMGVDHPGDMDYLLRLARPNMAVMTGVGSVPVHVEFFKNSTAVLREKAKLLKSVASDGFVVINADDTDFKNLGEIKAHAVLYGISSMATVRIVEFKMNYGKEYEKSNGISFKISHKGLLVPINLYEVYGRAQALAAAAAFAVGILMGVNSQDISSALEKYRTPPGRLRLIDGKNGSIVLDDSYNAAPAAVEAALETLKAMPASRRIIVLGDMLELGSYSDEAHRKIGALVPNIADILITVGRRSSLVRDQALKGGFSPEKAHHFDNSKEVATLLLPVLKEGDIVLVKGGQSMRMERVVEGIMAEPKRAYELLCRQSVDWKRRE